MNDAKPKMEGSPNRDSGDPSILGLACKLKRDCVSVLSCHSSFYRSNWKIATNGAEYCMTSALVRFPVAWRLDMEGIYFHF